MPDAREEADLMSGAGNMTGRATVDRAPRKSAWPARLDLAQSLTGLLLAAFLAVHLLLDSAILFGSDAADFVAHFFEGRLFFGSSHPWIVSAAAVVILVLVVIHAALALRKFPHAHRDYAEMSGHVRALNHTDTRLWWWQAATGFALFFLVAAHLFVVITQPDAIGADPSTRRVVEQGAWALYRLSVKWGVPPLVDSAHARRRRMVMWIVVIAYLVLGLASLATYLGRGLSG
jgi:fumarate reductase subunit C